MRCWPPVAAALLIGILGCAPAAGATPPTFAWQSPQTSTGVLPAGPTPFTVLARLAPGEQLQQYALNLTAGAVETLAALVPAGAPPVEVTLLAPGGGEFSLPSLPEPQTAWLGGIRLARPILYPYTPQTSGTYIVAVQPGAPDLAEPYALQGNRSGRSLLFTGRFGLSDLLRGPVTWLQSLLWLWG